MAVQNWIVSQIGAREHYAIARALQRRGRLGLMYTDAWCRWGRPLLRRGLPPMRAIAGRWHAELPDRRVMAFTWRAIRGRALASIFGSQRSVQQIHLDYIRVGQEFCADVNRHLARQPLTPGHDAFLGFDTGCLETLQMLESRGIPTVVDQIDPARVEEELVYQETQKWPGWQMAEGRVPEEYWQRLDAEWRLATQVLVNSAWSKRALMQQGVPAEKIVVVPLAYEPALPAPAGVRPAAGGNGTLQVLWLGSVLLRKGIQYLIEAARRLRNEKIRFVVAGPWGITSHAVRSAPPNMEFVGRVTRDRAAELYRQADLFVLPTLSDGFAITQIEAMSYGLPVITTPNCGEVVSDGVDGLIVPPCDGESLAAAIQRLRDEPGLRQAMSRQALDKSRQFTLDHLGDRLVDSLISGPEGGVVSGFSTGYGEGQLPDQARPGDASTGHGRQPEWGMHLRNWTVSQIGARQHYAVARAMQRGGRLRQLYTDAWCRWGRAWLSRGTPPMRGLAGRWHPDLPDDRVRSFTWRAIQDRTAGLVLGASDVERIHLDYIRAGRQFAQNVCRHLAPQQLDPDRDAFFAFDTGCLETLELLRDRGIFTVVDQIDPARSEEELIFQESQKWPGWQRATGRIPQPYWDRLAAEWKMATRVLVNSAWSRQALVQQGVPAEKIIVVPLAYEAVAPPRPPRSAARGDGTLVVLWLGSVVLRKGIQYLVEAARRLQKEKIRFVVAGPVGISTEALRGAPANMKFVGRVLRAQVPELYQQADLFVLPTLSDGFAITQIEAMSYGLPVIATPNCGEVVSDGVDGLLVPAADAEALAAAIERLRADEGLRAAMSRQALEKSRHFSLEHWVQTFLTALQPGPHQPSLAESCMLGVKSLSENLNPRSPSPSGRGSG